MAAKKARKKSTVARSQEPLASKKVALDFTLPDGMVGQFADNMIVSHTGNEFILSFTQTLHPLVVKPEEAEKITSVEARCVARVILTPAGMNQIVEALQTNLERYQKSVEKKGE